MAHVIHNPQVNDSNSVVELDTTDDGSFDTGTIDARAKCLAFYNNGDGAGGGSEAEVGPSGNTISLPPGCAKNYPVIMGPGGTYGQIFSWNANGNQLLITVIY